MTVTEHGPASKAVARIEYDWTSDGSGDAEETSTEYYTGLLYAVAFIPDSGGTQPTDAHDITLTDENSVDLLAGGGADLSNAANTYLASSDNLLPVVMTKLTCTVANAGASKGGKVIVYIVR